MLLLICPPEPAGQRAAGSGLLETVAWVEAYNTKKFHFTMTLDTLLLILAVVLPLFVSSATADDDFLPPIVDSSDISYFFADYDLDGLHWALSSVFARSARNPNVSKELPQELVARGGGITYTSEYKLKHDLEQAHYLVKYLKSKDPDKAAYFESSVIPIYEKVLDNIPPLDKLERTKGLYAFTKEDYSLGIADVYNKGLYMTSADELDPNWRQRVLLNEQLNFDTIQRQWFGENPDCANEEMSIPGVVVIDNLLDPATLSLIREILLKNTWWYQTKTPLEFGKYVGSYIDDVSSYSTLDSTMINLYFKLIPLSSTLFTFHRVCMIPYFWSWPRSCIKKCLVS